MDTTSTEAGTHRGHEEHRTKPSKADRESGEPVVGERTIWWGFAGLALGAAGGWFLGYAFGVGRVSIPGLAVLLAGGAGVPALVFATTLGALLGLSGAMLGTVADARDADHHETRKSKGRASGKGAQGSSAHPDDKRHGPPVIQRFPIYGSVALAAFMVFTLLIIARRGLGLGEPSDQANRVTWNQKNVARVGGARDDDTAPLVLQTAYPATRPENSPGTIIRIGDDWRLALAATPLIARPINAALMLPGGGQAAAANAELARLRGPSSVASESISTANPAAAAAEMDARLAAAHGVSTNVILVAMDADARWALPAGAYAARTGTPVLLVRQGEVPAATAQALQRRGGRARIFVLGPPSAIAEEVVDELGRHGTVARISGGDYAANAVRFAEFRDTVAEFGWGRTGRGSRQRASTNTILVDGSRWQDGVMAAHLARAGKSGPLLFASRDDIPAVVDGYLWRQRPPFAGTPAEGPFNHVWIVGSFDRIGYLPQAWADYSQEVEQYMTHGDSGVSGLEALGMAWIILALASAIWIAFHARRRMPDVMPMMKAAWTVFALLFGPVAVILYVRSYHRQPKMRMEDGMTMWHRPPMSQAVSATVMMYAFDMMLMVLAVFLLAYFGFPIIRSGATLYILGSAMFLMMVLMYLVALVVMMLVFHTPMTMHERKMDSYGRAFVAGFPIMAATMTVESLGMMPTMWWAQMSFLPGMQMPTEDDFTMWVTLVMAAVIGFLVVLLFNYWLVRRGTKQGTM